MVCACIHRFITNYSNTEETSVLTLSLENVPCSPGTLISQVQWRTISHFAWSAVATVRRRWTTSMGSSLMTSSPLSTTTSSLDITIVSSQDKLQNWTDRKFSVGESKKAAQAASTFLLLLPDHEDMAANLDYYTQVSGCHQSLRVYSTQINAYSRLMV